MLIKKIERQKNNNNLITNTLSNQNIFKNNFKKNNISICSSFRQHNGLGNSKIKNTISFGNNVLSKTNMSGLYNVGNKENINYIHNNNALTSSNLSLL